MASPYKSMSIMDGNVKRSVLSNFIFIRQPMLIEVPRKRLMLLLLAHWLLMYILIVCTVWIFVVVTVPFLTVLFVHFYGFAKVWRAHRYSLFLLNASTCIVFIAAILTAGTVRKVMIGLFSGFL